MLVGIWNLEILWDSDGILMEFRMDPGGILDKRFGRTQVDSGKSLVGFWKGSAGNLVAFQ